MDYVVSMFINKPYFVSLVLTFMIVAAFIVFNVAFIRHKLISRLLDN